MEETFAEDPVGLYLAKERDEGEGRVAAECIEQLGAAAAEAEQAAGLCPSGDVTLRSRASAVLQVAVACLAAVRAGGSPALAGGTTGRESAMQEALGPAVEEVQAAVAAGLAGAGGGTGDEGAGADASGGKGKGKGKDKDKGKKAAKGKGKAKGKGAPNDASDSSSSGAAPSHPPAPVYVSDLARPANLDALPAVCHELVRAAAACIVSGDLEGARDALETALDRADDSSAGQEALWELAASAGSCEAALHLHGVLRAACSSDPGHPVGQVLADVSDGPVVRAADVMACQRVTGVVLRGAGPCFASPVVAAAERKATQRLLAARFLDASRPVRACMRCLPPGARVLLVHRSERSRALHVSLATRGSGGIAAGPATAAATSRVQLTEAQDL